MVKYVLLPFVVLVMGGAWAISEYGWKGAVGLLLVLLVLPVLAFSLMKRKLRGLLEHATAGLGKELTGAEATLVEVRAAQRPADFEEKQQALLTGDDFDEDDADIDAEAEAEWRREQEAEAADREKLVWLEVELDIRPKQPEPEEGEPPSTEPVAWSPSALVPVVPPKSLPIGQSMPNDFSSVMAVMSEDGAMPERGTVLALQEGEWVDIEAAAERRQGERMKQYHLQEAARALDDDDLEEDDLEDEFDVDETDEEVIGNARVRMTIGVPPGTDRIAFLYTMRPVFEVFPLPPEIVGMRPIVIDA